MPTDLVSSVWCSAGLWTCLCVYDFYRVSIEWSCHSLAKCDRKNWRASKRQKKTIHDLKNGDKREGGDANMNLLNCNNSRIKTWWRRYKIYKQTNTVLIAIRIAAPLFLYSMGAKRKNSRKLNGRTQNCNNVDMRLFIVAFSPLFIVSITSVNGVLVFYNNYYFACAFILNEHFHLFVE